PKHVAGLFDKRIAVDRLAIKDMLLDDASKLAGFLAKPKRVVRKGSHLRLARRSRPAGFELVFVGGHGVASKRNVVVEVVVGRRPEILVRVRSVGDRLTLRSRRALARRAFPRAAREDDVRGEDFGAVALDPVLVLVARVAEAALHEDAGAFVEVSRQDLAA